MDQKTPAKSARRTLAALTALALVAASAAVLAQPAQTTKRTGSSVSTKVMTDATVQAVDVASRHVMVKLPSGDIETLKVSPAVRRLGDLKPGDKIKATYYAEVAFTIAEAGKPLPENTDSVLSARARENEPPGAAVSSQTVVTGAVLAIDLPASKVKVVNTKGGEVHELDVATIEGHRFISKLKVGDKVTARVNEALMISVERE